MTFKQAIARLEGVRRAGAGYVARCPAHEDRNPSLSVREGEHDRVLLKCFAGCEYHDIVAALGVEPGSRPLTKRPVARPRPASNRNSTEVARRIWREARDPKATIVQDYLFGRGRTGLMPEPLCSGATPGKLARQGIGPAIPASIRFHPRLRHRNGAYYPAMVAAIEDLGGQIVGIQRTFLWPDGTGKAEVEPNKMGLGRLKGCAVHLTGAAPELVICEGIETGLSILQATGLRVWAALGTANLGTVKLPGFVREVVIAADHDGPGLKAAHGAAELYRANGCRARIASPGADDWDFNDLVRW